MTNKQIDTTRRNQFFKCNSSGQLLFSVQPGIPSDDALSWVSCFLDTVVRLLEEDENPSPQSEAACRLAQMAKALVDAVEVSHE